jgi:predicted amidophosphoribosyltransferase
VLLVDDVITTGTTISVAARALRSGGVGYISVVAAARTPLKRARPASDTFQ